MVYAVWTCSSYPKKKCSFSCRNTPLLSNFSYTHTRRIKWISMYSLVYYVQKLLWKDRENNCRCGDCLENILSMCKYNIIWFIKWHEEYCKCMCFAWKKWHESFIHINSVISKFTLLWVSFILLKILLFYCVK